MLAQGCPTCSPLKLLMWPSDYFQFSGNNESYENKFSKIAETHLKAEINK